MPRLIPDDAHHQLKLARGVRRYLRLLDERTGDHFTDDNLPIMANHTNATRPDPTTVPSGTIIFNTEDGTMNTSNGSVWLDPTGTPT
jgi:hypothetical protein